MMSLTALFALFALLVLMVVFGLAYKIRGLRTALLLTAAAFVVFAVFFAGLLYVIVNSMN
jgi:hypothetical protein